MQIYQRYIISNITSIFLIILFTITSLVWLSQVIKIVPLMGQGVRLLDFINITILLLPILLFSILPFAIVLAIGIVYNKFSYEREIIILNNISLSPWKIIKPAIMVAFAVSILGYCISLYLLPISTTKLKNNLKYLKDNYASGFIQEKTFTTLSKNIVIYVNQKLSEKKMKGIIIFDNSNKQKNVIIFATYATVSIKNNGPSIDLIDGMRQDIDQETGNLSKMHFNSLSVSLKNENQCHNASSDPKCFPKNINKKDLNEFFLNELIYPDNQLAQSRKMKLKAESNQRILWPLMITIIPIVFLSIFMQKPYSRRGNSKIILKAIFTSLIFVIIHFVFYNLASKNSFFGIFCYVNVGLFSAFSYYLLRSDSNLLKEKFF